VSDTQQNATPKKRPRWAKAFLAMLAESGNIRQACEEAKIDRSTAYRLRESDPSFAADWSRALDMAADLLEQEARRRAYEGWEEPVFGSLGFRMGTGEVGRVRKYSDTLLIFLLKGARPEVYRETVKQEHSGDVTIKVVYGTDRQSS
jgi:hypothetical protein